MNLRHLIKKLRLHPHKVESSSFWTSLLGYTPKDIHIYQQAMTHRSASRESNERLEYLGDAVISLLVGDALFNAYPEANEGFLTKARSKAVCRDHLNQVARRLHLEEHIYMQGSHSEQGENVYGNALEALVGAIYLDAGFEQCRRFVTHYIVGKNMCFLRATATKEVDFKSRLLEWGQAQHKNVNFCLLSQDYDAETDCHKFLYQVKVDGKAYEQASGHNKLQAQQQAAKRTLKTLESSSQK